jgi:hypothetical protein
LQNNYQNISRSLAFLNDVIKRRLDDFFKVEYTQPFAFPELVIESDDSPLYHFLAEHQPNVEEYTILLLALMPHIAPNFIDLLIQQYLPNGGEFTEIGGVKGNYHRGTLPTGETALFIITGNNIMGRMQAANYFSADHFFAKEAILVLEPVKDGEPRMSGKIILQPEYVDLFTTGEISKPTFGPDFPAKLVSTKMDWADLVLNDMVMQQVNDIKIWLDHNNTLMQDWGMQKVIKPGYRALFHGPPGTGKTLTATLLGKQFGLDVYRIDLSQIVSKYIGETEKNLEKVFTRAEHKNWILFFDEADALFGKRSNVQNSNDKYANQEVSYLLQRVEDFPGLIILASNYKSNIDQAFVRRFNIIVKFTAPNASERLKIWQQSIPAKARLAKDVDLVNIADRYELSGSSIIGVVHYASLQAIHKSGGVIQKDAIIEGITREYDKEERVFSK